MFESLQGRQKRQRPKTVLPSLKGLRTFLSSIPSVKTLGYFQGSKTLRTAKRLQTLNAYMRSAALTPQKSSRPDVEHEDAREGLFWQRDLSDQAKSARARQDQSPRWKY